jgi:dynein heavy chain, axonemal
MAAMGPPGGGRTVISRRLQSRFNLINMTFPSETEVIRIFGSMINQKLIDFEDEFRTYGDIMTKATINIYESVIGRFLPTPTKIHYLFNLRDISKVFQGLLRCDKRMHTSKATLLRLWIHECFRVFYDRLNEDKDTEAFINILSENLGTFFDQTYHNICPNKQQPIFADFMNVDQIYQDLVDFSALKAQMERTMIEYNEFPGQIPMDIVLFRDAIEHVCRIVRVIRQPKGNMLLIGIGGSGRQSLSKLASFICLYSVFQIELGKNYKRSEFREDLKRLYKQAGISNKETTFIFVDTQVAEETFLEDINNILSSGEVPNLFKIEELEEIKNSLQKDAKKNNIDENNVQAIYNFLLDRVKANLHVIVCMSPIGEPFRNRIRMYPALVNCTTIDLFKEWPPEALLEVGEKYLSTVDLKENENVIIIFTFFLI